MARQALLFLLAIVPGLLICWYIYNMDKYEKESRLQLAITFGIGMLATYPALKIESWASHIGWDNPQHLGITLFSSFIVVALTEELAKFFALIAYPYSRPFFNEPMDGIVYAVMISMGFATLENVLYAGKFGFETTIIRAFTAVPAHAAFAIMMGYFVGRSKYAFSRTHRWKLMGMGLLVPIGVHGLYDFFILQEAYEELMVLAIILLGLSIFASRRLIREHQEQSPFREEE